MHIIEKVIVDRLYFSYIQRWKILSFNTKFYSILEISYNDNRSILFVACLVLIRMMNPDFLRTFVINFYFPYFL